MLPLVVHQNTGGEELGCSRWSFTRIDGEEELGCSRWSFTRISGRLRASMPGAVRGESGVANLIPRPTTIPRGRTRQRDALSPLGLVQDRIVQLTEAHHTLLSSRTGLVLSLIHI